MDKTTPRPAWYGRPKSPLYGEPAVNCKRLLIDQMIVLIKQ